MKNILKDKIILLLLGAAILVASFFAYLEIANLGKTARGLMLANRDFGGLSSTEAIARLHALISEFNTAGFTLSLDWQSEKISPLLLGVNIDENETLKNLFAIGRDKNPLPGLFNQMLAFFGKKNLAPVFSVNPSIIDLTVTDKFKKSERPSQNASLLYDKKSGKFKITPSTIGLIIDKNILANQIRLAAYDLKTTDINLTIIQSQPDIKEVDAESARQQADSLLQKLPHQFYADSQVVFQIEKNQLISWLDFEPTKSPDGQNTLAIKVNQGAARDYLEKELTKIFQKPINAVLGVKDNEVIIAKPGRLGVKIDFEAVTENMSDNILNGASSTQITLTEQPSPINADNLKELGLTSLLAKGSTSFDGSPVNRNFNIKIASSKFDGVLLEPGKELIFGDLLGDVGPEQGYKAATVIKNGLHAQEYGGGICQVSTTLFRGAIKAGLKITERHNHSVPIAFYAPQGFDATVYPPAVNLKFVNDTPNYIYIQTKLENKKLTFEFYGTKTWDEVKLTGPTEYDKKEDGSMKAVLKREIIKNGQIVKTNTWYSIYKSPQTAEVVNPLQ